MSTPYDDIIQLPHPEPDPQKHPRMSLMARAAQFAPFAALGDIEADFEAALRTIPEPEKDEGYWWLD